MMADIQTGDAKAALLETGRGSRIENRLALVGFEETFLGTVPADLGECEVAIRRAEARQNQAISAV